MTERQLLKLFDGWVRTLELRHWQFDVRLDIELPEGSDAWVTYHDHYEKAQIIFSPEWKNWPQDYVERVIVHELLHVALRAYQGLVKLLIEERVPNSMQSMIESLREHVEETIVERFADVLVDLTGSEMSPQQLSGTIGAV